MELKTKCAHFSIFIITHKTAIHQIHNEMSLWFPFMPANYIQSARMIQVGAPFLLHGDKSRRLKTPSLSLAPQMKL